MKRTTKLSRFMGRHQGYLWIAPSFLLVALVTVFPMYFALSFSISETAFFTKTRFVGFANYARMFQDTRFWTNVANTLAFTFGGIAVAMLFGLMLALLIRDKSRTNSLYRTIILIPWVTNEVVIALMWKWILNPNMSIVYYWLRALGIDAPNLLSSGSTALVALTFINAWRSLGFSMIMIQAGLSAIPKELEEAAAVDGAGGLRRVFTIIIPLMRSVLLVTLIVLTISFFNVVSLVLTMTGGGPGTSTEILSIRLYKEAFKFFDISSSGVLTVLIVAINLLFVFFYKRLVTEETYY